MVGDVRTLIMEEAHAMKYYVHPGTDGKSERTFWTLENMFRVCVRNLVVVGILTFREDKIGESKMIRLELEQEMNKVVGTPYPLSPRVPFPPPAVEWKVVLFDLPNLNDDFLERSFQLRPFETAEYYHDKWGIHFHHVSKDNDYNYDSLHIEAAICWNSKELEGEEDERGAFVLTLEFLIRLRKYLTLDLLSIIARPSQGVLSKKLSHAAESKAS
nr:hypothetical protein [Tanacetum cinerariifolium]